MARFADIVARYASSEALADPDDAEYLRALTVDWQLLADLSMSDLVLWLPARESGHHVAVAHCRPLTRGTVFYDDMVGYTMPVGRRPYVDVAFDAATVKRERKPRREQSLLIRDGAASVVCSGRVIAVVSWHTNLGADRNPSRLELTYAQCANKLFSMIASGRYPTDWQNVGDGSDANRGGSPRVGDGLLVLNTEFMVTYASPNAVASLHRLGEPGNVIGSDLTELVQQISEGDLDDATLDLLRGRRSGRSDISAGGTVMNFRSVALFDDTVRAGAMVLTRDVTELRVWQRQLLTKQAAIAEINHRVKNNLQTVSALLRLQYRGIDSLDAKYALAEAIGRISAIAVVHENLSQSITDVIDFDELLHKLLTLVPELSINPAATIETVGMIGPVTGGDATALALVVNELIANAIEHGTPPGSTDPVVVSCDRKYQELTILIEDRGPGMPKPVDRRDGLGLEIVTQLVNGELNGDISWLARECGGTTVRVQVRLADVQA